MIKITEKEVERLISEARKGMKNAYVPRSNFPVGAAILTDKGDVYKGCNVESVVGGLGTCAERCVIDNAVSNGDRCFKAIVIVSRKVEPTPPCGACLQYLSEFAYLADHDIIILMVGSKGKTKKNSVNKMLPENYGLDDSSLDVSKYKCKK